MKDLSTKSKRKEVGSLRKILKVQNSHEDERENL